VHGQPALLCANELARNQASTVPNGPRPCHLAKALRHALHCICNNVHVAVSRRATVDLGLETL
jgi:hypothetical protein